MVIVVVLLSLWFDVEAVLVLHDGKFCVPATTTRSGESFDTIESQSQPKRLCSKLTDWAELESKRRNWRINVRIRLRSSKSWLVWQWLPRSQFLQSQMEMTTRLLWGMFENQSPQEKSKKEVKKTWELRR